MWWALLIIGFAVALVIGPVMWLSPSPRDARLSKLRSRAAGMGLHVSLVRREKLAGRPALPIDEDEIALYSLPWESPQADRKRLGRRGYWSVTKQSYSHERFMAGQWLWQADSMTPPHWPGLEDFLQNLPVSVLICEARPQGVMLGWLERGDTEQLELLYKKLQELRALSLQAPSA